MTGAGFEPASANTEDLKSSPLDHSGKMSGYQHSFVFNNKFEFELAVRMFKNMWS